MVTTATPQTTVKAYGNGTPTERRAPWNVMGGTLQTEYPNVATALDDTGLDFTVVMGGALGVHPETGAVIQAPNNRCVIRPDGQGGHLALAFTGKRFTPIQNAEAFSVADLLVAEYEARIVGAADYRGGGASLLTVDLGRPVRLFTPDGHEDVVDLNLLIKNAHDGSSALTFALTGLRPACTNAVQAAVGGAKRVWKISHTPNAAERVDLARQAIIATMTYQDEFQAAAQAMLDTAMVEAEFDKIVSRMWHVAPDAADTKTGQRRLAIQDEVKALYRSSSTLDHVRGTRWGGYNAVTEWLDWARPVRGADDEARAVSRAEGSLEGAAVRMKARTWDVFSAV